MSITSLRQLQHLLLLVLLFQLSTVLLVASPQPSPLLLSTNSGCTTALEQEQRQP